MTQKVPENEVLTDVPPGVLTHGLGIKGLIAADSVYDDSNVEQMASISPEAPHRAIDLAIIKADTEGTPISLTAPPSR